jgi:phospholipase C
VRIAFDGDAVLFSDEAERVFQAEGLDAFQAHELSKADLPLPEGPFKPLLMALHRLQMAGNAQMRIRTALVTARSAPAHERAIRTLMNWNIRVDEAMFLGGLPKGEFLREFEPDFFFDDQTGHVDAASRHVPAGHVSAAASATSPAWRRYSRAPTTTDHSAEPMRPTMRLSSSRFSRWLLPVARGDFMACALIRLLGGTGAAASFIAYAAHARIDLGLHAFRLRGNDGGRRPLPGAGDASPRCAADTRQSPRCVAHRDKMPNDKTMTSRRKFLTGTATTGAAALALSAFPPSIRRALAIPANNKTGTIKDVEHVVILMQENRSFDHYFGTLMGVRGFGDRFTIPLPKGRNVWQQEATPAGSSALPPRPDQRQRAARERHAASWNDARTPGTAAACTNGRTLQDQRGDGLLKEAELQFQFALANAFTVCDSYHCSMHTGTNSNRLFHWTGTNGPPAPDSHRRGLSVNNEWDSIGRSAKGFPSGRPTRAPAGAKGVSWIVYQNMPDNFGDNPLAGFKQFARPTRPRPALTTARAYDEAVPYQRRSGQPALQGHRQHHARRRLSGAFRKDIREGKLPQVSWIVAPDLLRAPRPFEPVQGAWYLQEVLDALTAVPEVWSKTVLLVNFDENDGYFDHVPSPSAPSLNGRRQRPVAGKTTLADADLATSTSPSEAAGHRDRSPRPTAASTARARACRCT